jgi:hypothetical protein
MRGVCRAGPCLSSAVKDLDTIIEIGGFILARKAVEQHRSEGGSGKFGGANTTLNGQKPFIVIGLGLWELDEVNAMKVRIEYCVP